MTDRRSVSSLEGTRRLPSDQDAAGRSFGREELELLREVLERGTLTSTKGPVVTRLERRFAEIMEVPYVHACSSGTAAIHAAIVAVDPEPGEEVITSPITDMGAITPILYQGAIPVFADVDPRTLNVTAESVRARISERTRAVVVTHLFGNPAPVDEIVRLLDGRDIVLIEDCAQAFLARCQGAVVGTIGDIGCFSLQQGKHVTCGEGGLVVTGNSQHARRMELFINKAWGYGDPSPDHYFLALNSRLSELQGAVALAQVGKLRDNVRTRQERAERLTVRLGAIEGLEPSPVRAGDEHVYWRYAVRVDQNAIPGGPDALAASLREIEIDSMPRYIKRPAFECEVIAEQRTFGESRFPFTMARPEAVDYDRSRFRGAIEGLESVLVLPWNERYEESHVALLSDALAASARREKERT